MRAGAVAVLMLVLAATLAAGCGSTASTSPSTTSSVPAATDTGGYGSEYDSGGSAYSDENSYGATDDEQAQIDWENQEGDAWDEFTQGYLEGWDAGCDVAFEGSPDGYLYVDGDQYSADDCYGLAPYDATDAELPYDVPFDAYGDGEMLGETDGCNAAFEELAYDGSLYYGEEYFDSSVCP